MSNSKPALDKDLSLKLDSTTEVSLNININMMCTHQVPQGRKGDVHSL